MRRLQVPLRLRTLVRLNEIAYTAVAAVIGLLAGLCVIGMQWLIHVIGLLVFEYDGGVSGAEMLEPIRAFGGPVVGGALLGFTYLLGRRRFQRIADPIEANAVRGGKLGLAGSFYICVQTVLSSGFGASVGMEAAYTQAASSLASAAGQKLRVRRETLRQLVAAGAGGAIAAAFDAPLTGAFYAFELVLAYYSVASLVPVMAACIVATAVTRWLGDVHKLDVFFAGSLPPDVYIPVGLLAVLSAIVGIFIMRSVAAIESAFRKSPVPGWLQPLIGGVGVGLLALVSPRVLSSGHGAMETIYSDFYDLRTLAALFVLKIVASILSIGSGFRGGLFFASLFLGALLGQMFGMVWLMAVGLELPIAILGVVGMCALATAIIGAPLAMSFLALETTQSLPLGLAVLFAALVSTVIVRQTFGFTFATWRFHLRGETIRSAADIGWVRDLTVGRMMRRDLTVLPSDLTVAEARERVPLGATKTVPLVDKEGRYAGLCLTANLHANNVDPDSPVLDVAIKRSAWLRPYQDLRSAMQTFSQREADTLAVLDEGSGVIGLLNEDYCLRRYVEETNKRLYPSGV